MASTVDGSTFSFGSISLPENLNIAAELGKDRTVLLLEPKKGDPDYILKTADETSDITFDVEGREFHTNRAVLAHYSPVFQKMLFSDFREKDQQKIPLPGKKFKDMVVFFQVLFPRDATSPSPISDDSLVQLLTLADEYQVDQVKVMCQNYIGEQLAAYFYSFYDYYTEQGVSNSLPSVATARTFSFGAPAEAVAQARLKISKGSMCGQTLDKASLRDKLLLYLWACDQYSLPVHRTRVKSLLVALTDCLNDMKERPHYTSLPHLTQIELLENLCVKFEAKD